MKKFKYTIMTAIAVFMTSCSNADELLTNGSENITISVNAPVTEMSRAAVALPEGYTMQCKMQLLAEDNTNVGTIKTQPIDAATGKGTFVITSSEREKALKAIFWAEYIDGSGKSVYNSSDLKSIGYTTTSFDLNDKAAMAATDAFCGKADKLEEGVSVTLVRPFINLNFTPNNPDKVAAAKSMELSYKAPAGFNVLNSTSTSYADLTYSTTAFDASADPWFSTFLFAPNNLTMLESEVNMGLSNGLNQTVTIPANTIPFNPNFKVNVTATIGDLILDDINIGVDIDPDYNVPATPEFGVGCYINAQGEPVAARKDAVAIVFHTGGLEGDMAAFYGDRYAGKTIKGYAVAIENVNKTRLSLNTDPVTGLTANSFITGAQGTNDVMTNFSGSDFVKTYESWTSGHKVDSDNLSDWYIPTLNQLSSWLWMIFPSNTGTAATGTDSFKAMFPDSEIFDRDPISAVYYLSVTINSAGNYSGVRLNTPAAGPNAQQAGIAVSSSAQSAMCRTMLTIFE